MGKSMQQNRIYALSEAVIFTGEEFVEGYALVFRDGRIMDIIPEERLPPEAEKVSCKEKIIAPGFIDCQVNGGGGVLFNTAENVAAVTKIAASHARRGSTRIVLTFISDRTEAAQRALRMARDARKQCRNILGVHFEGPHLNPERRGVHKLDYLRGIISEDFELYKALPDEVIIVTLAPELVSSEQIARLHEQNVIVSLGHSSADVPVIKAALKAGATCFSHIFNAMGGIEARRPGLAGTGLDDKDSWCSIIADGHHVSDEVLRIAQRAKPRGKLFFVSDAMPPAAADSPRSFPLFGEIIRANGGRCVTSGGRLAGGAYTLAECVRHAIVETGMEPKEALRMASLYPAEFLGLDHRFGRFLPGFHADIVIMDGGYRVEEVWADGKRL